MAQAPSRLVPPLGDQPFVDAHGVLTPFSYQFLVRLIGAITGAGGLQDVINYIVASGATAAPSVSQIAGIAAAAAPPAPVLPGAILARLEALEQAVLLNPPPRMPVAEHVPGPAPYKLRVADKLNLGGVKQGSGVTIAADGAISATGGGGGGPSIETEDGVTTEKISAMTVLPHPPTSPVYVAAIQQGNTVTNYQASVSTLLTGVSLGTTLSGQGITITAGPGGTTSGFGGPVYLNGGAGIANGYSGGQVYMRAGGATNAPGSNVGLYASNGSATGAGNYQGGGALFIGGNGVNAGPGGGVYLQCGNGGVTGLGGSVLFRTGAGGATSGNGGTISLISGNAPGGMAGPILLEVGTGGPTAHGNGIVLQAGAGGVSSGFGGSVHLYAGLGTPNGYIYMHNLPTANPGLTGAVWRDPITNALSATP